MLGKIGAHARQNLVAYIALFFALGLGTAWAAAPLKPGDPAGGDLAGTYPNPDIAAGAVSGGSGGKIADDTVTGDDVLESSLGKVDDADTLDGKDSSDFGGPLNVLSSGARSVFPFNQFSPGILASRSLTAGSYLVLAKTVVRNANSFEAQFICSVSKEQTQTQSVLDDAVVDLGGGRVATLALTAPVTFSSTTTVKFICRAGQGAGAAADYRLVALRVDSIE